MFLVVSTEKLLYSDYHLQINIKHYLGVRFECTAIWLLNSTIILSFETQGII